MVIQKEALLMKAFSFLEGNENSLDSAIVILRTIMTPKYTKDFSHADSSKVYDRIGDYFTKVAAYDSAAFYVRKSLQIRQANNMSNRYQSFF